MSLCRSQSWAAALVMFLSGAVILGCSGRKQVPFGLADAGLPSESAEQEPEDAPPELPVGEKFEPDQVEVRIGESTLVLQSGYALSALQLDLDKSEPLDALVVSATPEQVRLQAAFARDLSVVSRDIDSFLVPAHCIEPRAEARQLSDSLVAIRVEHACETGTRTNVWLVTVEAQPRVRERITVLPANALSNAAVELELSAEDRDADGYEDVVAEIRLGGNELPLAWLNRPGGFARDTSQPEATLAELAEAAWTSLDSDPAGAEKRALQVIDAFMALCRESGGARIGLSGTRGLQCRQSPATARAVAVAMAAAIRRGAFVRALELQRWWGATPLQPTPEERALVQSAWQKTRANTNTSWRMLDQESASVTLLFIDERTLLIDGASARSVELSTGAKTRLSKEDALPPVRSPDGRFAVQSVRATCAGFEAEVRPTIGKRAHRVLIERRASGIPCRTAIDRQASAFEWAVLGWAPQGLLAASGDMLRIVPLNELAKPAGSPIALDPGNPLPAPIRGARVTPDGSRYVIPHVEGVVVRDWRKGGSGFLLRPADWSAVPGELRSVAISPNGTQVAVQKGNEIRLLSW